MPKCSKCGKKISVFANFSVDGNDFCSDCYSKIPRKDSPIAESSNSENSSLLKPEGGAVSSINGVEERHNDIHSNGNENTIAKIINIIGKVIIAIGFIAGIIIWGIIADKSDGTMGFIIGLTEAVVCFISGMLFIGLSEIIKLLQINANNTSEMLQRWDKKD